MSSIGPNKLALRQAFQRGRRAGVWLAKYGPTIQVENRKKDVGVMRGQDKALEGLGDVFERAETEAEAKAQRRAQRLAERKAERLAQRRAEREAPPAPVKKKPMTMQEVRARLVVLKARKALLEQLKARKALAE